MLNNRNRFSVQGTRATTVSRIKVENSITHFRLPIVPRPSRVPAFIPRNTIGFAPLTLPEPYTIIDTLTPSDTQPPDSTPAAQPQAPPPIMTAGGTLANR